MDKQTTVHQHNGILFKNKKKQAIKKKKNILGGKCTPREEFNLLGGN